LLELVTCYFRTSSTADDLIIIAENQCWQQGWYHESMSLNIDPQQRWWSVLAFGALS
jgi:hypothetical protein